MTLLQGKKVKLRPLERSDLNRTLQWINDPDIFIMMGTFGPRTALAQERWYENIAESRTNLIFAVCLQDGGEHIGNASLFDIDFRNGNAGLTIALPDISNQGQGLGREAVFLLCQYGFKYLNLHKVYCKTDNLHATRMYEKLGFVKEGVLRQQAFHLGRYVDKIVYGVIKDELSSNT